MNSDTMIWLGVILILLGVTLILIPTLGKFIQLEKIPDWLIYVYESDGFYFVTSPILLLITILTVIMFFLRH
ncbi:hypothetical protein AKJ44_01620 [candidate division MSBL1 archaeon SCGC-AAA261F17]|uniref:DUF2905 domain-containing protein n=1 Tax=candidate division MSBL1 archaeon SCGC-AAA261F17 TaxID=1698274 RepID=A0A133V6F5_9EURY|nr:hypothetical protein AKJ44_01620 [candidate division MSBL1 archaeon SCGC-AAA261F17]